MACEIVTKSDIDDSNIKADTHIQEEDTLYSMIKILIWTLLHLDCMTVLMSYLKKLQHLKKE